MVIHQAATERERDLVKAFTAPHSGPTMKRLTRHCIAPAVWLAAIGAAQAATSASDDSDGAWQAKFQSTYIWQRKPAFHADYSGANSFSADTERGYTFSATAFLGARPLPGTEIYFNPEVVQGDPLSKLIGVGGAPNGEAQKVAGTNPTVYRARLFLRQTVELGGTPQSVEADFNRFAATLDSHRIVATIGNFALNDIFDGNAFAHDPRTQFMNWTIMDYGAWDFAADARGFTLGVAVEFYWDDLAVRVARAEMPVDSNNLPLNARLFDSYGDNVEIEQGYRLANLPGKIRGLFYRNVANMGTYTDANALALAQGTTPHIADTRTSRAKTGYGLGIEQDLTDSIGVFARYSSDDGKSEEYNFTEVDRSRQAGLSVKGDPWSRAGDTIGLALVRNELSASHRDYLAMGGLGFFLGDGRLDHYRPEEIAEAYYSARLATHLWLTLDYQRLENPGYNADRGPASVYSSRIHAEF